MTAAATPAVRLFSAVAIRSQIDTLAGLFERAHGVGVATTFDLNPAVAARIRAGEAFDVGMTNPRYVGELIDAGLADAATHVAFGRIPLAIAGRGDGPGAGLASHDDLRALLRRAESIAYTAGGTSGRTFREVAGRIGVWDGIAARTRPMGAGRPVAAVAAGDAELAVAPLTTVIASAGVEAVAVLPPDLRADIEMSMFSGGATANRDRAMLLLRFLSDPSIDPYLESTGVERFRLA